eukprot:Rmarinus@m.8725
MRRVRLGARRTRTAPATMGSAEMGTRLAASMMRTSAISAQTTAMRRLRALILMGRSLAPAITDTRVMERHAVTRTSALSGHMIATRTQCVQTQRGRSRARASPTTTGRGRLVLRVRRMRRVRLGARRTRTAPATMGTAEMDTRLAASSTWMSVTWALMIAMRTPLVPIRRAPSPARAMTGTRAMAQLAVTRTSARSAHIIATRIMQCAQTQKGRSRAHASPTTTGTGRLVLRVRRMHRVRLGALRTRTAPVTMGTAEMDTRLAVCPTWMSARLVRTIVPGILLAPTLMAPSPALATTATPAMG